MRTVTITQFCQEASHLLSNVEKGETYIIVRHGKPIAEIIPYTGITTYPPSWKRRGLRLQVKGASLSSAILSERTEE
ncbi:MAG: type II toxin-antitoxin system prevent-host-death family antitoxin [Anaerolineae bacterium]|nr:type II toxin-antitoxin system prevent-host-death family antitoxin [Anaerolineae bacterium]